MYSYASIHIFPMHLSNTFLLDFIVNSVFVEPLHPSSFRLYCLLAQRVSGIIPKHENWNPPPATSSA